VSSTLVVILLGLAALYAHVNVTLLVATRVVGPLPEPRPLSRYTFAVPRDGAATGWGVDAIFAVALGVVVPQGVCLAVALTRQEEIGIIGALILWGELISAAIWTLYLFRQYRQV
jgi:hypothetical protein